MGHWLLDLSVRWDGPADKSNSLSLGRTTQSIWIRQHPVMMMTSAINNGEDNESRDNDDDER